MFRVLNMSEFWILANFRKYDRVLNMRRDAIMEGFWIFQDYEYARFLQIQTSLKVLNMSEYHTLIMSQYAWICLNKAEYDWIYRHIPKKNKKKNCQLCQNSERAWCVYSKMSLEKLDGVFRKKNNA